jgi:O-antigen ligase/tetratricopeptide (TPR) repeat protein
LYATIRILNRNHHSDFVQYLIVALTLVAFFIAQALIGGAKLVFAIPAYLVIAIASLASVFAFSRKKELGIKTLPLISTFLLAGYVIWRGLISPIPYLALPDLLMVGGALCVYLLVALYVPAPRARVWLIGGCFLIGFLHVVAGVLQFRYKDDFMFLSHLPDAFPFPQIFRNASGWRASGFYVCPNHMAGYLESLAVIALAYCCWGRFSPLGRIILGYVAVYCLVGIALTGSRGGYLSTGFALVVLMGMSLWFLKKLRSSRLGALMIASVLIGVLVIGGAAFAVSRSATIGNRMSDISYDAGSIRYDMWGAAIKQTKLNPVFGTGAGTYLYYGRQFRSDNVQRDPIHVHCDYLELLAEYGIVGCVFMLFFMATHIHAGFSTAIAIIRHRLRASGRSFSNELAVIAGALATIAALLAHSVVDFNFHLPANTLFFAAVFGILASPTSDPKLLNQRKNMAAARFACFALPVVAILLSVKCLSVFRGEYYTEWARVHLRNKLFVDNLASFQAAASWSLAPMASGLAAPSNSTEAEWSIEYQRLHLFPEIRAEAENGMSLSPKNVDAPYYAAEALHFSGVYEPFPVKQKEYFEAAVNKFIKGKELFPQDTRYNLKLARTYMRLGRVAEAEAEVLKAIKSDPNFGNCYAIYGLVLWQQGKFLRAEAYYKKAVGFPGGNDLARVGLQDVARIRSLAANPEHVENFGNPFEQFDMELPTEEDNALGVGLAPTTIE